MLPRSVSVGYDIEFRRALSWFETASTRYLGAGFRFRETSSKDIHGRSIRAYMFSAHCSQFALRKPRPAIRSCGVRIAEVRVYGSARNAYPYARSTRTPLVLAPLGIGRLKPGLGTNHVSFGVPIGIPSDVILSIPSDYFGLWANSERRIARSAISKAPPAPIKYWSGRTWEIFRQFLPELSNR